MNFKEFCTNLCKKSAKNDFVAKIVGVIIAIFTSICLPLSAFAERIDVAFTIDNNYPIYTLLAINSILTNNTSNSDYVFWIVENNITKKNKNMMKSYVEKHNQKINFINISTDKIDNGKNFYQNCRWSNHVTKIGTARILLPEILPPDIDKVIYMDSDILVLSDLKELYDTDITNYAAAMARNNTDIFDKIPEDEPSYFNSGVILINTNFWRRINATQKMIEYMQNNNLQFPDQDAINKILSGKIYKLNQKWNNQLTNLRILTSENYLGGIIHYIGNIKPWHVKPNYTPEVILYYQYWDKSGLKKYQNKNINNKQTENHLQTYNLVTDKVNTKISNPLVPTLSKHINVAFTIDNNYWLYTLLAINSILKNNHSNSEYNFYIIENNLSDKNKEKMKDFVEKYKQNIEFINFDTSIVDDGIDYYKLSPQHSYISRIAIARIFIPELIPNVDKILYLDSDILVTGDLSELYNIDLKNYPVAMGGDITVDREKFSTPNGITYFNDGVILMNSKYWRDNETTWIMAAYMKENKFLPKMDQDLFNIILKNKIMALNPKWNNQYGYISNENGIIHYIGPDKPWLKTKKIDDTEKVSYIKLYNEYWGKSPLRKYKSPIIRK